MHTHTMVNVTDYHHDNLPMSLFPDNTDKSEDYNGNTKGYDQHKKNKSSNNATNYS